MPGRCRRCRSVRVQARSGKQPEVEVRTMIKMIWKIDETGRLVAHWVETVAVGRAGGEGNAAHVEGVKSRP